MAATVLASKVEIRSVLLDRRVLDVRNLAEESGKLMDHAYRNDDFWLGVSEVESILGPFAEAIKQIQSTFYTKYDSSYVI